MENFIMRIVVCTILFVAVLQVVCVAQQNVGINNDGSLAHPSAMLDIKSFNKGLLIPRMNTFQRTNIIESPATGLQVYDTDTNSFWFYNGSGWVEISVGGSGTNFWSLGSGGSIYNNTAFKFLFGTNELGPGYVNIKLPVNTTGLFLSETGTISSDYFNMAIGAGQGTTASRLGIFLGNFGNGMLIVNQANAPLLFQTHSSEKMRITPAGFVGINTINPSSQLEVQTATGAAGITHTNGTVRLTTMMNSATSAAIGTTTNHPLFFYTNNTFPPAVSISTDGNLGIGGGLASAKVEAFTPELAYGFLQTSTTGVRVGISIGGAGYFGTLSNHPLYFHANNGSAIMSLLQNGNVGINTASPTERLTVQTTANKYGLIHTDGNVTMGTYAGGQNITGGWIGTKSNHPLMFFTNNTSESMTILQNGNVGIGTNNPTYKLSVNGVIQTKEIRVQTGWADFVFENDYPLLPLPEVEQFILTNKHLPGIPSAKEVERDGLPLGDMQTKMMQKIEELTLYTIQANKIIGELRQRVETLEKANK